MLNETFGSLANEKYKEYMGDVLLSARHLLEIINEVLDMSKIEAGRLELDEEPVDLALLIEAVMRMMASRAFSSGIDLDQEIDDDVPKIYVDSRLMRQVLINLVSNSLKFCERGGNIFVKVNLAGDGEVMITVSDDGVGIPKNNGYSVKINIGHAAIEIEAFGFAIVQVAVGAHSPLFNDLIALFVTNNHLSHHPVAPFFPLALEGGTGSYPIAGIRT